MLTDPFYDPAIEYSGTHVPAVELEITDSYVTAELRLVELLQSIGWSIVDSGPSYVVQARPAWYFMVSDLSLPNTPVDMTQAQCQSHFWPPHRGAIAGGLYYNFYDPRRVTPTCPGGTGDVVWVIAGSTTWGTAQNLATAMTLYSQWDVAVVDNGPTYDFTLTSKTAAFENDEQDIFIGGNLHSTEGGFYTLQSPIQPSGGYLFAKIENIGVSSGAFGATFVIGLFIGRARPVITITASGGGSFRQPLFNGSYYFAGSEFQFMIIPRNGQIATRTANSSMLAAMLEPPDAHPGAGTVTVVIGSDFGAYTNNVDQIRKALHWGQNLASGHAFTLLSTGWHAGTGVQYYQLVTMLVRGTVGRDTVGRNKQPLVQSAYICVPANPQTGAEAVIVGKLKDMIIKSKIAQIGAREMFDGKQWICISTSTESVDVYSSMWTLAA